MRYSLVTILMVLILVSCSTPRYAYYFDRHQYTTGKSVVTVPMNEFLLPPNQAVLTVSAVAEVEVMPMNVTPKPESREIEEDLPVTERKERKVLLPQNRAKTQMSIPQAPASTLDRDLKLSIIFGASGIVGLIIGGSVFWVLGSISLLIGVILLIKWVVRQ